MILRLLHVNLSGCLGFSLGYISGKTTSTIFFSQVSLRTGSQRGWKKKADASHSFCSRFKPEMWFSLQWTVHCTWKPLLTVSARIMLIYKQLSRSVNYLSQSCQQSSIQPIRSWYQELVSWNSGINGMSTCSPAHSLLTRPLLIHPVRPRQHSAISNGSLFAGQFRGCQTTVLLWAVLKYMHQNLQIMLKITWLWLYKVIQVSVLII